MSVRTWSFALALVALVVMPASPIAEVALAGWQSLQPGDQVIVGGAGCTLNFVYDGVGDLAGRVYMGTAAHCVESVGEEASTGGETWGHVAYIRDACCTASDYAFIEVHADFVDRVDPAVRGHPDFPVGVATHTETLLGDLVYISGYGGLFSSNPLLRHQRVGTLESDSVTSYQIIGPIYYGDSGGPIVHQSGKALGVVSRGIPPAYEEGPSIAHVLADAGARGFTVTMRTVSS